ncbi:MAG: hypothetical protein EOM67_10910, partial [Spirochaetia bacterium]|nr:hypothetical protein [Spirochaetia bacterium]
ANPEKYQAGELERVQNEYQNQLQVFQKGGEKCNRCSMPIIKIKVAGRSTHLCPNCQPL